MDLKKRQIITFEYNIPTTIESRRSASPVLRNQLTLIDKNTEKAIP